MTSCGSERTLDYDNSEDAYKVCDGTDWVKVGCQASTVPANCDNIGETCDDGSIYAGLTPDGDVKMYTTPADAASTYTWNDGTSNWVDTAMANCTDVTPGTAASCQTGEANTAFLIGATGEPDYPFAAAEYCDGLSANGHGDWYLPAQDELDVLYDNKAAIGGFNVSGSFLAGYYWSSSENDYRTARLQRFSDGSQGYFTKNNELAVRCVRQDGGGGSCPATCPDLGSCSSAGTIDFLTGNNLLAYCDGAEWISMGPPTADPCACDPAPGDQCADGTIYAGSSPDGDVPMYTTDADQSSGAYWGAYSFATGSTSSVTGEANTADVYAHVQAGDGSYNPDDGNTPNALVLCEERTANGHSDWYLPAQDELDVLYTNKAAIGGFNVSGSFPAGYYWSSSEYNINSARLRRFSDGGQGSYPKNSGIAVRCVRR